MENKENVSVSLGSHNRDINQNSLNVVVEGDRIVSICGSPKTLIGCTWTSSEGEVFEKLCSGCRAFYCPDDFVCVFDLPASHVFAPDSIKPLYKEVSYE